MIAKNDKRSEQHFTLGTVKTKPIDLDKMVKNKEKGTKKKEGN